MRYILLLLIPLLLLPACTCHYTAGDVIHLAVDCYPNLTGGAWKAEYVGKGEWLLNFEGNGFTASGYFREKTGEIRMTMR
jgi:hypothetical protein